MTGSKIIDVSARPTTGEVRDLEALRERSRALRSQLSLLRCGGLVEGDVESTNTFG
jgi:hypothetical protein